MKLTASQQQGRRGYSLRGPSTLDSPENGNVKSTATIFWLVLHGLCCLISLVLGFRFSRLVFFLVFSHSSTTNLYPSSSFGTVTESIRSNLLAKTLDANNTTAASAAIGAGSRVVVGRHGILIRPWPHPNPEEVIRANQIIERVQKEQRIQYGVKNPRAIIAITPTYVRTFQTLHLTGVMHTLMNVPYDLVWIVVEAGGTTNETVSLLAKSGLKTIHIGFGPNMPILWEDRHKLESRMRLHALRVVREKHLDGLIMFADDSNMHSMELFDEIQNVKWIGAISIGILAHSGEEQEQEQLSVLHEEEKSVGVPIQGPSCNASNNLVGWHTFDSAPYVNKSAKYIGDRAIVLPRKLEWASFVLNSRLVSKDAENRPEWVKDLDMVAADEKNVESPLSMLNDATIVEPLGNCGRKVMVWWLRVEARADSKFPPGWVVDPPLEITVPAKRTPWPDTPPEVPGSDKSTGGAGGGGGGGVLQEEKTEKHVTKTRSPHKKRSKKKHAPKATNDERSLVRHPREN